MISLIIPNFNKGLYIAETLDSVINQTFQDWEAIIVDDGSTDNSLVICDEYVQKDNRIKLIKRDKMPKGGSVCRNIGINAAKGKFIMFLDSDDVLSESCLHVRYEETLKNEAYDFWVFPIGTFYEKIGDSDSVWKLKEEDDLKGFLSHDLPWHTMSCLWRTDFMKKIEGFVEYFPRLQDVEMHTRALLEKNVRYRKISSEKVECYYRIAPERIVFDYSVFMNLWKEGFLCYLNYFYPLLEKRKPTYVKFLRKSILVILSQIVYQYQKNNIDRNTFNSLTHSVFLSNAIKDVFRRRDTFILKVFMVGNQLNINKIKGYNAVFRTIMNYV